MEGALHLQVAYCHQCGAFDVLGDAGEIVHGSNQCLGRHDSDLIEHVSMVPEPEAGFVPRQRQIRR
jgi:hypothetical protein